MEQDKVTAKRELIIAYIVKNKLYLIVGGIIIIAIVIGIVLALKSGGAKQQGEQDPSIIYLPAATRTTEETPEAKAPTPAQVRDPFSGGIVLRGVITGGAGSDLAMIEAGNTAYVVSRGATVAGDWTVAEISSDSVVLTSGNGELVLELGGRATRGEQATGGDESGP